MGIEGWSTTAADNTVLFPENMPPSQVNNGARQEEADIRAWYNDPSFVEYGAGSGAGDGISSNYTATYVSASQFTIDGVDVSETYNIGRKVRVTVDADDPIYGTISDVSYATDTAVTVAWLDTSLTPGTLRVWLGADSGDAATTSISGSALDGQATSPELKGPTETVQTPAVSSNTVAFTVADGGRVAVTLTDNVSTVDVTWGTGARSFTLYVIQDGTGGRTWAWPAAWKWAGGFEPTISSAADAIDVYVVDSYDGGSTVLAGTGGQAFS
jgi:hypothetical protein